MRRSAPREPQGRPSEQEEWEAELLRGWVDTHKRAMLTPVILALVRTRAPVAADALRPAVEEATGWTLTERGLYRTLKRLADQGLLTRTEAEAERTGAKTNLFALTGAGGRLLAAVIDDHTRLGRAFGL
ncbi:helix-turn-helix transcriptional regulator [Brevibacterium ihuae]|uniref:helix-turn-helix transcriptional regulator n=1 Tax=Brevibacterium ihuae TaxID=1631743 RepID=UPI000C762DE6|nr:helix-turn-helix transcriptional regulator [Brevibacterium ihuae]